VMQLIEGQNLLQVLQRRVGKMPIGEQAPFLLSHGPCSEQEVLTWLLPIMDVLQELHGRNPPIMHRDIKPGNIILMPNQTTVLVDFGLTRLYDPNVDTQTLGRAVTPGFSPLEQYVGKTSPQSDMYSLAATMYLLLTNRLPPTATSRTPHDDLLPPRQLNPSLSPKTERALLKALALHADERFQSMREFAQTLREPAFTAFSDRTAPLVLPIVPLQPAPPTPQPPAIPAQPKRPTGAYAATKPVPAKARPSQAVQTPPGSPSGMAAQIPTIYPPVAARPLPGSFGQGCLWGLIQGITGAVLVLSLRQEVSFYLATFIGYAFYVLAGFLTTRRGGSLWRGAWAGYWSGISSTIMFWIVLGIGLLFRASQYMQMIHVNGQTPIASNEFRRALDAVSPQFPGYMFLPSQPLWVNLLVLLGGGLLLAVALGVYGGKLGRDRYKTVLALKQVRKP